MWLIQGWGIQENTVCYTQEVNDISNKKMYVFWNVARYSFVETDQLFGGAYASTIISLMEAVSTPEVLVNF
jgi:hypothetical protein